MIEYAASGIQTCKSVEISYCTIRNCKQDGIDFAATGLDQQVSGNTFSNNLMGDIYP
jgi:nitrous oxidase accessory protein NosD